jgi:hypothetical protein
MGDATESSCIEFLANTMQPMLNLPLDDVITEILNDSDVVTEPIINGIPEGDFAPVERWLRAVQTQSGTLARLLKQDPKALHAVLSQLSSGLNSHGARVRVRCCHTLATLANELYLSPLQAGVAKWLVAPGGPLPALFEILQVSQESDAPHAILTGPLLLPLPLPLPLPVRFAYPYQYLDEAPINISA